jgi:hypothetical protein
MTGFYDEHQATGGPGYCPETSDGGHCGHWHEGGRCCACGQHGPAGEDPW